MATILGIWLAISMASLFLILLAAKVWSMFIGIKIRMAEFDRTMPLSLFNRRKSRQTRFRLRLTRRQIPKEVGERIENLNHAIDYLIDSYDLRKFSHMPADLRPAEFAAAEMLLQCRAEMLRDYLPLPSLSYLLKRRIAYLMNTRRTWV
jgi:predicted helicase